ncbi:uncharacterized protein LOC105165696 isoform X2 [Sesamum indicum]|uniref:Uncharacterized protein LOC105165696 isoform X2 n=1 Tax=Sesamum indicum TaxID=4182 RepID=A0A6I9TDS0_SESIN|nr:uncharacterized protein LOC105165696 isoform X2 [Sesamum indicum]
MRRKFKSGAEHPVTIGTGETTRNQGSDKPFEMRKAKKVRFIDTKMDGVGVPACATSSGGHEATRSPRSDAPKTSEYAYFVKVKNDAAHARCHSLHKKKKQLNSSTTNYVSRETINPSDVLRRSMKDLRSSVSGEMAGPSDPFLSPHGDEYDEPDQIISKEPTNKTKKRPQLISEIVSPVRQNPLSSLLNEASRDSENQCNEKEIFPAKRHRFCERVAHISSFGAEKLHPRGFDLVSSHLTRLLPHGNENNDPRGDTDNSSKTLTFQESGYLDKGLHLSHERDWDMDLPKLGSGESSEIVLSDRDTFASGFPFPKYAAESHVQDELMDLDQCSRNSIDRSSLHDCSFCTHYRSGLFHFKDLDEFGSIVEHAREPHGLSPEWDVEWRKHWADSSSTIHDTAKNVCPGLATTWNVNQQPIVDKLLDAKGLCSSPLISNYYLEFGFPFPSYGTENHVQDEFMDPNKHSRSGIGRSSQTRHGFSFFTPFEAYRSAFLHFRELDEFGSIVEHAREEPRGLLLEWEKDRAVSSITNHDTAKNVCHGLATAWNVKQQQSVDDVLDAKGLCSSPILSNYYQFGFPFPNYDMERHVQDDFFMDLDQRSKSSIGRSSQTQHDFPFFTPFEGYRSGFFHFKDLDEFGTIVECAREEPRGLLLEWDFESGKSKVDSSIINHDTAKKVSPGLATTWNVNPQQIVDNVLDAKGLCSSPLLPNYYLEFDSLPNYGSTSCMMQNFALEFDGMKCAMAESGQFPLALPCNQECTTASEDKNADRRLYNSNIIFSYRDQDWLNNKVWDGKPESEFWWKRSSAADLSAEDLPPIAHDWRFPQNKKSLYSFPELEEAPGEAFLPSSEGTFNHHFLSSNLQSSLGTSINRPLLLNHASQDMSGQELYFDDDNNKLVYR